MVPDRPGILGAVATALGDAGVDIVSLDVLERGQGVAVDDVVVELPGDRLPDTLITAAQAVPGVTVESLRPFAGPLDTHRELELLESLARAAEGTSRSCWPPSCRGCSTAAGRWCWRPADDWEVVAASDAAPVFEGVTLPWMPLTARGCCPARTTGCPSAGGTWPSR